MAIKRKFERVALPGSAPVFAEEEGRRLGRVNSLGRGGMMVETTRNFVGQSPHRMLIIDEGEDIRCEVVAVALYRHGDGVGFEFPSLEIDAAVEIGVILGRYYQGKA
jgi:PilZ domain